MITYQAVIAELAKHVAQAQSAESEAQKREELSAIRALCDVALHNETQQSSQPNIIPKMMINTANPLQKQTSEQIVHNLNTNKLEEDDANGDSIFEF